MKTRTFLSALLAALSAATPLFAQQTARPGGNARGTTGTTRSFGGGGTGGGGGNSGGRSSGGSQQYRRNTELGDAVITIDPETRSLVIVTDEDTHREMTSVIKLMVLGLKHFRFPRPVSPTVFSDSALRALQVPTLLLMGDREVIYDSAKALSRARRLIPNLEAERVSGCSHDMTVRQHRLVDGRVVDFLTRHEGAVSRHADSWPD